MTIFIFLPGAADEFRAGIKKPRVVDLRFRLSERVRRHTTWVQLLHPPQK